MKAQLVKYGVDDAVLALLPQRRSSVRRIRHSFGLYGRQLRILLEEEGPTDIAKVGAAANAFAVWLAACRFVVSVYPHLNTSFTGGMQDQASMILLGQLAIEGKEIHPAFQSLQHIPGFNRAVRDAFDEFACYYTLRVLGDETNPFLCANGPRACEDRMGMCLFGCCISAKDSGTLPKAFRQALFNKCMKAAAADDYEDKHLFDRMVVEGGVEEWQELIKAITTPKTRRRNTGRQPLTVKFFRDLGPPTIVLPRR